MRRKEFLGKAVQGGMGVGALFSIGACHAQQVPQEIDPAARKRFESWVDALMRNLEAEVEPAARTRMMVACGRACARRGAVAAVAKPCGNDLDKLVAAMAAHIGKENARREGSTIHITYSKCYCPIVGDGPSRLPAVYCECSRGWLHEVFETVADKAVDVRLTQSIKRGDAACRFEIRV